MSDYICQEEIGSICTARPLYDQMPSAGPRGPHWRWGSRTCSPRAGRSAGSGGDVRRARGAAATAAKESSTASAEMPCAKARSADGRCAAALRTGGGKGAWRLSAGVSGREEAPLPPCPSTGCRVLPHAWEGPLWNTESPPWLLCTHTRRWPLSPRGREKRQMQGQSWACGGRHRRSLAGTCRCADHAGRPDVLAGAHRPRAPKGECVTTRPAVRTHTRSHAEGAHTPGLPAPRHTARQATSASAPPAGT